MSGGIDEIQDAVDGVVPLLEKVLFVFDWSEVDDAVDAVDSAGDGAEVVESAEFLLAVVPVDGEQLADAVEGELAVVLADDADVVLHEHAFEFLEVGLSEGGGTSWWL